MSALKTVARARDVMTADPVCVDPSTTLRELARVLQEYDISGAPVLDPQGRVIGMVTKTDLIRRCSEGIGGVPPAYLFELMSEQAGEEAELGAEPRVCVEDFMTQDPVTARPETPIAEVARAMFEGRFHRVPVVDQDRCPVGIITSLDLLGVYPRDDGVSPRP